MSLQNKFSASSSRFDKQMLSLAATNEGFKVHLRRRSKRDPFWPHLFMALFGAGWAVSFDFGARIYGAEFVSLLGFLILPWRKMLLKYSNLKKIILIYMIWLGAIALSDLINQSSIFDWARNSSTPISGAVSLIVCSAAIVVRPRALLTFLFFTAAAKGLLGEASYGDALREYEVTLETIQENTNIFKVRIEPVLTPLIILIASLNMKQQLKSAAYLFAITGGFYLLLDSRSGGLVFLLAAAFLAKIQLGIKLRRRIFLLGLVSVLAVSGGYAGYVKYTLTYNPDGHNGRQLQQLDNPYNPLGMLVQGRSEWSVLPLAISERPLFGWGSWAEDKDLRFSSIRAEKTTGNPYALIDVQENQAYIPAHSLVGSAWLWSGILAFGLMVWLLRIVVDMGLQLAASSSPLLPAGALFLMSFLWSFFFSPPMAVRLSFPIALATLIVLTDQTRGLLGIRSGVSEGQSHD
jgi:hypothetical protein